MRGIFQTGFVLFALGCLCLVTEPVLAAGKSVLLELNNARQAGKDCRISFLISNQMGIEIEQLSLEAVVFDDGGYADKFLVFNTGRLPKGKSIVRQFDLANKLCSKISRILLNRISVCKGVDLTARICLDALATSSRIKVKFGL